MAKGIPLRKLYKISADRQTATLSAPYTQCTEAKLIYLDSDIRYQITPLGESYLYREEGAVHVYADKVNALKLLILTLGG